MLDTSAIQTTSSSMAGSLMRPTVTRTARGRGLSLRSRLVLLVIAALVPMIIFSAAMMLMHIQQQRDTRLRLMSDMARELAGEVDAHLQQAVAALRTLGQSDALRHRDLSAFHALAGRLVKAKQWENLQLLSRAGEHLVNTRVPFGGALPPLARPEMPLQAVTSGQPIVSGVIRGVLSDRLLTTVYVPIVHLQGRVEYVIAVSFDPARWNKIIRDQMGGGDGVQVLLLDRSSQVIASSLNHAVAPRIANIEMASFAAPAGEPASSAARVRTVDGQSSYVASQKVDLGGWTVATFIPTATLNAPRGRTVGIMGGGFLLLLLSGLYLARLLGQRTAKSIQELVASVQAVAGGTAPLPIASHIAEVDEASHALTETAALLAARLRSEEIANAKLESADKAKMAFLALLGHELRNPLAPIRNAVQLIQQAAPGSEASRWAASVIDRQSAHLSRLVDDLLDVTRIDHGKIELRKDVVDLRQLLQSALQDHRGVLEQAGVLATLDLPATAVLVHCDRIRIAQVIGNLLHNAAKFTARGGRIVLRAAQDGPVAILEVSDSGSGISPGNLEKIFELFAQEQPSGVGGNTGLGIGLALTRKLVGLHGGTIRAASEGPGRGSTFRIELPAANVAAAQDVVARSKPSDVKEAAARVLVVDDNRDSADTLREMLAMNGFSSTVAYSGQAALDAVEHEVPDAVLLDIGLPDLNGYEVCQRIRRSAMTRQPALIALTGWGQENDRVLALRAGFDAHLTKPADADRLIAALKEMLVRCERSLSASNAPSATREEDGGRVDHPPELARLVKVETMNAVAKSKP